MAAGPLNGLDEEVPGQLGQEKEQGGEKKQAVQQDAAAGGLAIALASAADLEPLADGGSTAGQDDAPASKRQRLDHRPLASALPEQPVPHVLAAFPVAGTAAADPALLGARVSGRVEAVCGDTTLFVTLTIAGLPAEFKGALFCPPPGLLTQEDSRALAASVPAHPLKRPRTAFNFFSDAVRPGAKERNPHEDQKGISKIVGEMWSQLPTDQREPYHELAKQDKERYERELREYQARQPQSGRRDNYRHQRTAVLHQEDAQQPGSAQARSLPPPAQQHAPVPSVAAASPAPVGMAPGRVQGMPPASGAAHGYGGWSAGSGLGLAAHDSLGQLTQAAPQQGSSRDLSSQPSAGGTPYGSYSVGAQQQQQSTSYPYGQTGAPGTGSAHSGSSLPAAATLSALLHHLQSEQQQGQAAQQMMPPPPQQRQARPPQQGPEPSGGGGGMTQLLATLMGPSGVDQPQSAPAGNVAGSGPNAPLELALVCAQLMQLQQQQQQQQQH